MHSGGGGPSDLAPSPILAFPLFRVLLPSSLVGLFTYNTRHLVSTINNARFFPMSNILPYNFDTHPPPTPTTTTHGSMTHSSSSSSSHRFASSTAAHVSAITPPPPVTINSHSSSSSLYSTATTMTTPTPPLSALTVAEWAGVKQDTSK